MYTEYAINWQDCDSSATPIYCFVLFLHAHIDNTAIIARYNDLVHAVIFIRTRTIQAAKFGGAVLMSIGNILSKVNDTTQVVSGVSQREVSTQYMG